MSKSTIAFALNASSTEVSMARRGSFACRAAGLVLMGLVLVGSAPAQAQNPQMIDRLADRIVSRYQTSSCDELRQQQGSGESQPAMAQKIMQRVMTTLRQDPQARAQFVNKVAAPVMDKMIACGMFPPQR
ncbi:MAG: hypothetical protein ACFCBW_18105 [Candidatus Competibacterales bacterium]